MRRHLTNSLYGALDYISYPLGMLLVAPIVLHKLGGAEYGLWMIATSVISAGGIIASGFCDAGLRRIAELRGVGDRNSMLSAVRSLLGINLVLGTAFAIVVWIAAPYASLRIAVEHTASARECLISLRIAGVLILVRSIESVGASTQRAFERYSSTVRISSATRLFTLAAAAVLAIGGHRTVSILLMTGVFLLAGAYLQFRALRTVLGSAMIWPAFQPRETRVLLGVGIFVWLQALGSVAFGQFDRILLGVSLGALAVAPYALSIQIAQPIFGLTASCLHFLFPYLSGRAGTISTVALRRTLAIAFACNLALVASGAAILLLWGDRLLRIWAGPAVAHSAATIFRPIVLGTALMGLGVTGTYALQALGRFRTVALLSLSGRAVMLVLMIYLLHHLGLRGLATARVCYGAIALVVYLPLLHRLGEPRQRSNSVPFMAIPDELQRGFKS